MTEDCRQNEDWRRGRRCEDCGGWTFFNHSVSSGTSEGWRHTHGNCKRAAETLEILPLIYDGAMSALAQIQELCGRFISESDDEEYGDPQRLREIVHGALGLADEGIRADVLTREAIARG